ncbi:RNA-directed DNA polymerase from mobile element jockey [Trichonephila clavipes]|nr:RNA-directed DNA polymerase from mobile element jockey [Trichonephila clavipes]
MAEVIADSLQQQFEPNHVADREVFDQRIHEEVANFLATPHVQEIEPTTPTEALTYVQRIKPKIPGLDQISNPQNYRPISLLSCLSKVYEFVLMQRLNQHCAAVNFIIPQQCGFRPKCSTVHQLLRVTELIHSGFAKHEATGILFLDIAKAFDKIWHDGLLIKLIRLDFSAPLIKSIHSFLSHRSFRSSIPYLDSFDVGLDESGVLHSALWHGGDWLVDGIREAWQTCFIRMGDVQVFWRTREKRKFASSDADQ